ncbi:MAG: aspartate carbamoyltransferase catalytic subunit [Proteobacteria bacterium]|jgi:aspartate carbamoyltransferase catalytic subunit|nr:aspartate carbamoyltransferase catalytic subunit [Pseudomonadota bacterium]
MSLFDGSLIDLNSISSQTIDTLFNLASSLKKQSRPPQHQGQTVALLFFEPSTRTRMSFETAAARSGLTALVFDGGQKTSLEKGETVEDSILNVAAMGPEYLVIRCGDEINLRAISKFVSAPILNAGWGVQGHPTQALLDTFTLREKWERLEERKLLIVGDVRHSRVAHSHFELASKVGLQIAVCCPEEMRSEKSSVKYFSDLSEALSWCDAVMALRVQFERHSDGSQLNREVYSEKYGLNKRNLRTLKSGSFVMHPGPINHGLEMDSEVIHQRNSLVLSQVSHGVFLREALFRMARGETW